MGEELDPQEVEVAQQGEMFRQGAEPEPAPEPVVEAAPEPVAAEPELPPVEPDWLSAPALPEAPPPPPQQYYEPPPQQYPQQPQVPRGTNADVALQTFVDNPDGWLEQRMAQRDQQMVGPLRQQQQAQAQMTAILMNNYVTEGMSRADAAVRKAYEVFNRDATFRSDKEMQQTLQSTLQGMRDRAREEAWGRGNLDPLRTIANLDESDMVATLAYMKAKRGKQSPGVGPLRVEGAALESSRSSVAEQSTELPPEFEEIAHRLGPGGRERLIKQIAVTRTADDFEG